MNACSDYSNLSRGLVGSHGWRLPSRTLGLQYVSHMLDDIKVTWYPFPKCQHRGGTCSSIAAASFDGSSRVEIARTPNRLRTSANAATRQSSMRLDR